MKTAPAFTKETFQFFRELGRNNHKPWMDANRHRYQAHVVAPLRALLERLTPVVHRLDPNFDVVGRTGVNFSRVNRDIRFAKDKSPYRTHMYLMFPEQGTGGAGGQLYVGISADVITVGFRVYSEGRDSRLARVAAPRTMENAQWLARQARRLRGRYQSYWYGTEKGQWVQHNAWPAKPEEWKRIKGWVVRRRMKPGAATRPGFIGEVTKVFRDVFPLYCFVGAERWKA